VEGIGCAGTVLADAKIACGPAPYDLIEVQPEGKSPMSAEEWLRGARLQPGPGWETRDMILFSFFGSLMLAGIVAYLFERWGWSHNGSCHPFSSHWARS
jgi:hypothetical protein